MVTIMGVVMLVAAAVSVEVMVVVRVMDVLVVMGSTINEVVMMVKRAVATKVKDTDYFVTLISTNINHHHHTSHDSPESTTPKAISVSTTTTTTTTAAYLTSSEKSYPTPHLSSPQHNTLVSFLYFTGALYTPPLSPRPLLSSSLFSTLPFLFASSFRVSFARHMCTTLPIIVKR
ncbi:hypothetical protein E2C01_051296 [Portunus trituberculatus]|uniref:Uncharacterized protein n=1 Tax=Portunus trituberculatus TaxID=210409 RepID=A0A5B7GJX7_PORTR|nr:hypothetical protein [Portunus trituberculatus]